MSRAGAARDASSAELFSRPAAAAAPAVVVADGEDVPATCTRRGPRRMFVEVVLPGPWVSTTCLCCRVIDTSHGLDLESVRARVERQHAACLTRLGRSG